MQSLAIQELNRRRRRCWVGQCTHFWFGSEDDRVFLYWLQPLDRQDSKPGDRNLVLVENNIHVGVAHKDLQGCSRSRRGQLLGWMMYSVAPVWFGLTDDMDVDVAALVPGAAVVAIDLILRPANGARSGRDSLLPVSGNNNPPPHR
ncbi:hypothetical protein CH63R_06456 [Colletotrichum higginsianum IMI 349063]|uniref:Uncharacterized protein n=1 Tax=Colletotrichum higginsianum (strain IMI 349063) TaxID=759273 RepID=A0A1B7YFV6_COLHI|nr:hypothetical protein CH63R_06456 [Colletotrichum higginsianum IMI 349063]OBR10764.1 hypothetical protein CH63R_06456 [Colletotrichum higginsianum IMI 349063]